MARIVRKERVSPEDVLFEIEAPEIAKKHKAGQFVIVRHCEGERVPLTIVTKDAGRGTITLLMKEIGRSTHELGALAVGEEIDDLCGPLGNPTPIENYGTAAVVGGGVGVAPLVAVIEALAAAGNRVVGVFGARTKELLVLRDELSGLCDEIRFATEDGSFGTKGRVTVELERVLREVGPDVVFTAGPVPMMKAVCDMTRGRVKTIASLNSIMLDGTGMCGGCRVAVGGEIKFTCVDGPEFDGHLVDFEALMRRLSMYRDHERDHIEEHRCRLAEDVRRIEENGGG